MFEHEIPIVGVQMMLEYEGGQRTLLRMSGTGKASFKQREEDAEEQLAAPWRKHEPDPGRGHFVLDIPHGHVVDMESPLLMIYDALLEHVRGGHVNRDIPCDCVNLQIKMVAEWMKVGPTDEEKDNGFHYKIEAQRLFREVFLQASRIW